MRPADDYPPAVFAAMDVNAQRAKDCRERHNGLVDLLESRGVSRE